MLKGLIAVSKAGFDDIDRVSEIDSEKITFTNDNLKSMSCELADMLVMEKYNHDTNKTHEVVEVETGMTQYNEVVQDVFNVFYDEVESMIIKYFKLKENDNGDYEINANQFCNCCYDELDARNCPDA
tara:strand:- start:1454 stop:1834 length:381 start_codon:yes stop_codon:yes gene_type:complete